MIKKTVLLVVIIFMISSMFFLPAEQNSNSNAAAVKKVKSANQLIIWTANDKEVALNMVFMYTFNCQKYKWMDKVRLLVWGASTKLLSHDQELQKEIKKIRDMLVIIL